MGGNETSKVIYLIAHPFISELRNFKIAAGQQQWAPLPLMPRANN